MKKLMLLFLVLLHVLSSKAQISERENDNSTYLFGARPIADNFGFYLGMSTVDINDSFNNDSITWTGIPIINIKYYYTDKIVVKAGIHVYKKRRSIEGGFDDSQSSIVPHYDEFGQLVPYSQQFQTDPITGLIIFQQDQFGNNILDPFGNPIPFPVLDQLGNPVYIWGRSLEEYTHIETEASWNLNAGIERHFDMSNIIDAYVGLNGNLGYSRAIQTTKISWDDGDYNNTEGSSFGITYGLETIIGINLFVADLPIAVGFEYGASFKNYGANKFKYEYDEQINTGTIDQTSSKGTYYLSQIDDFEDVTANSFANNVQFADLKAKRFDIMSLARLTFTYYLKR
jgi:hypothetical protein